MEEVVLQVDRSAARDAGSACSAHHELLAMTMLPKRSTRAESPGSRRWSRRAAPEWPGLRRPRRPAGRGATRWLCRASARRTRPAVLPRRGGFERCSPRPAGERREIEVRAAADRGRAQRHDPHGNARQQAAERRLIARLEGGADDGLGDAGRCAWQRDRQRHRHACASGPTIVHVELVMHVDALDRDAGGVDDRLSLLGPPRPSGGRAPRRRGRRARG